MVWGDAVADEAIGHRRLLEHVDGEPVALFELFHVTLLSSCLLPVERRAGKRARNIRESGPCKSRQVRRRQWRIASFSLVFCNAIRAMNAVIALFGNEVCDRCGLNKAQRGFLARNKEYNAVHVIVFAHPVKRSDWRGRRVSATHVRDAGFVTECLRSFRLVAGR